MLESRSGNGAVLVARARYYASEPTTAARFWLAVVFIAALLAVLIATLLVSYRLHVDRIRSGSWGRGGRLGIVFVAGEVLAILGLALNALEYGWIANSSIRLPYPSFYLNNAFSMLFLEVSRLIVIVLMFHLLHDRTRSLSPETLPNRLWALRCVYLSSISVYAPLAAAFVSMEFVLSARVMGACAGCGSSVKIRNKSYRLGVAVRVLYASLAIYWLVFSLVLLGEGRRKQVGSSVKLFLAQLLVVIAALFNGLFFALYNGLIGISHLPRDKILLVFYTFFVCAHLLMVYLGLLVIYAKRNEWAPVDPAPIPNVPQRPPYEMSTTWGGQPPYGVWAHGMPGHEMPVGPQQAQQKFGQMVFPQNVDLARERYEADGSGVVPMAMGNPVYEAPQAGTRQYVATEDIRYDERVTSK
ncbi:hypothetical protein FGG08_006592 [Glutinoglossum americanum]|uniref:Uncharacterized protein n=1 Tax=Glutinoglossum americanum TaxID=1670608 RepID=A0A9P8HW03_9PEZI|nr:hypothetical protein FGG08_006592 [Glutinoglossum americanum]